MKIVILVLFSVLFLGGAWSQEKAGYRTLVDMGGRSVTLPSHVRKIATSGTAQTQLILMLSGTQKLCATLPQIRSNPWICKIYPGILTLPTPFGPQVDLETLAQAKPDVVTLWSGTAELQKKIEALGIPVVIIYYDKPEEIQRAVLLMAEILGDGAPEKAREFCAYYQQNLKRVESVTQKIPAQARKKVYYTTDTPLTTEGKDTMPDSWITLSGGINVAAAAGITGFKGVDLEQVAAWNPDVVVVRDGVNREKILADPRWKNMEAVKKNAVYLNPKGINVWCARSADSALQPLWAAQKLYPELFPDVDIKKEVAFFYQRFYSFNLGPGDVDRVIQALPPQ